MQRKLFLLLVMSALLPALMLASGKIRGKVTDAGTGEALVGANVVVTGTSMGAATNTSGEYTILNIPSGTYVLKTSYVGYQAITISNVRVNNDLTTDANFQLPAEGVTVATVEIVAERPMINKSATNAVRIIDSEFFSKIPSRGVNTAIAVQPGVVDMRGNIFIRGGRADEVGFRVEGVGTNDILFGGRSVTVTAEAVEQIQVQAGGFNAEYGGANAGLVQTQLRTGNPDRWNISVLGETDRFAGFNKNALGGWSYGYSDMTATFSGPVPGFGSKLRVFAGVQNTFYRDATLTVRAPWNFSGANAVVTDDIRSQYHPLDARGDTLNLSLPGGVAQGGGDNRWVFTGTALLDLSPVQIRFAGSYNFDRNQSTTVLPNLLNLSRLPLNISRDGFANVKISHVLSPTLFYEASFNYYANTFKTMDPELQDNLNAYGDPAANAALGYNLQEASLNWPAYQLWGGAFTVNEPGAQIAGYEKRSQRSFGGRVDLTSQVKQHEFKVGGEFTQYTVRRYAPSGVFQWYKQNLQYANDPATLELVLLKGSGVGSDNYGYDIFGAAIESDDIRNNSMYNFGPRKPVFAAAYVQDKIELSDIILNLGLRWDYINPDSKDVANPADMKFDANNLLLADQLIPTAKTSAISPRIGFSFPVSDRTVFHAQYGKFIQQTKLRDSYVSAAQMAGIIKGGFFVQGTWGWGLKPTRTTQYEAGFSQQVSDFASFDVSAFYKDIQDQITWVNVSPAAGTAGQNYGALVNADFATSKGIELKFTLRRTNRVQAQFNYTFADTRTTGSNTASTAGLWSAGSVVDPPKYTFPADFNQANRGSVLLDYRFAKGDGGPVLQQLGLNVLLTFNSGHAYTRLIQQQRQPNPGDPRFRLPVEPVGASTTPWFFQLDARLDKSFAVGPFELNLYAYVVNLLGTDNAIDVYPRSGDPSSDGWFGTAGGAADAANYGQQYVDFYNAVNLGKNSGNWGPPRQIRFGVKLDY
jgi:outer membrane receptor protein involved in Fe transport